MYLKTLGEPSFDELERAEQCLRTAGIVGSARRATSAPWIAVQREERAEQLPPPQSPEWFAALLDRDTRHWDALKSVARALSNAWPLDVVTLEGAPALRWVRYARWRGGITQRCFEYAANDIANAGWVKNEGAAEPWEDDEEVGPDLGSLARALEVPGLDAHDGPRFPWLDSGAK